RIAGRRRARGSRRLEMDQGQDPRRTVGPEESAEGGRAARPRQGSARSVGRSRDPGTGGARAGPHTQGASFAGRPRGVGQAHLRAAPVGAAAPQVRLCAYSTRSVTLAVSVKTETALAP